MKITTYLILFALAGCLTKKTNRIAVYLENNSDVDSVVHVKAFINDKLYKVVSVKRITTVVKYEKLIVELPVKMDSVILKFVISKTDDSTSCVLNSGMLNAESSVHVNFNEVIFKKGFDYLGHILQNDSVVKRKFYSEVITK